MNKKLKYTLIAVGAIGAVTVTSLLIAKAVKNKKKRKRLEEEQKEKEQQLAEVQANLGTSAPAESSYNPNSSKVIPVRNMNKEIINPLSEIRGVVIYPAQKSSNPELGHAVANGKANLRNSPEVNNAGGHWTGLDSSNYIGEISGNKRIGVIVDETFDNMTPKMRWFKVCLIDSIRDCSGYGLFGSNCTTAFSAWVRADNVTFKSFDRPSTKMRNDNVSACQWGSFSTKEIVGVDGSNSNALVKYKTNYMLGAEVFPHTNWLNPITAKVPFGTQYEFEDLTDL
jgi:hypothetical protein